MFRLKYHPCVDSFADGVAFHAHDGDGPFSLSSLLQNGVAVARNFGYTFTVLAPKGVVLTHAARTYVNLGLIDLVRDESPVDTEAPDDGEAVGATIALGSNDPQQAWPGIVALVALVEKCFGASFTAWGTGEPLTEEWNQAAFESFVRENEPYTVIVQGRTGPGTEFSLCLLAPGGGRVCGGVEVVDAAETARDRARKSFIELKEHLPDGAMTLREDAQSQA